MKLSIIIINYNVKYFLEQCLRAVKISTEGIDSEVIVVDNASTDGSNDYLPQRFPWVRWIASEVNCGFSHGNNIGFGYTSGEYVLMLNPDTIVTREAMLRCVEFMDENRDAGAVGVKMVNRDGSFALESRRGIVTPWVSLCKATGLCKRYPDSKIFGHYYMSYLDKEQVNEIEMVSGAFMMLRRSAIDKVGFLDEQFFMYWEDSDLSYRIMRAGYKNYYLPYPILHYKGESSVSSKLRYRYWLYYSLQIFFKKHFPLYNILSYIPLKLVVFLLKFQIHHANPIIYGRNWDKRESDTLRNFIVVGSAKANNEVREILKSNGVKGEHLFVEADESNMPQGHLSLNVDLSCYDHVLYDCDSYSYDTVIRLLQLTPGNSMRLATYSTETKVLITDGAVYLKKE
ncbi:MAG: glycosyltransferase family 2 protein [Bacteroidaceae bacterium]|nr:glycosyltransferase family 2 protein [Bacteroidaceae bacterium]